MLRGFLLKEVLDATGEALPIQGSEEGLWRFQPWRCSWVLLTGRGPGQ